MYALEVCRLLEVCNDYGRINEDANLIVKDVVVNNVYAHTRYTWMHVDVRTCTCEICLIVRPWIFKELLVWLHACWKTLDFQTFFYCKWYTSPAQTCTPFTCATRNNASSCSIGKSCQCKCDPLTPYLYIEKLECTWVYIHFLLFLLWNMNCGNLLQQHRNLP